MHNDVTKINGTITVHPGQIVRHWNQVGKSAISNIAEHNRLMDIMIKDMHNNIQKEDGYYVTPKRKENKMFKFWRAVKNNARRSELIWRILEELGFVSDNYKNTNPVAYLKVVRDLLKHIESNDRRISHLIDLAYAPDYFEECPGNVNYEGLNAFDGLYLKSDMVKFEILESKPSIGLGSPLRFRVIVGYTLKKNAKEHKATIDRFARDVAKFRKQK